MEKAIRPEVLGGIVVKRVTACGNMYVQMAWYKGKLFEVFATLGHSGGCASCQTEAITRSVTLGLRFGIPPAEYARQLQGIQCPEPLKFPKAKATLSCPDAIGKITAKYGELTLDELLDLIRSSNDGQDEGKPNLSDEEEMADAVERMEKQKEEREKSEDDNTDRP